MRVLLALALLLASVAPGADPPRRIVSSAPSITEMLYALGLGDRVVGVTDFCHYPPEVRAKPKIGAYLQPSIETILALRPDLAAVLDQQVELHQRLESLRIPTIATRHNDLAGIEESMRALAARTGVAAEGERVVAAIHARLEAVRARAEGLPRRRVLFLVGRTPGAIQDLMAVGEGPFLNELIEIAGGTNPYGRSGVYYPRIAVEDLYANPPEVVIDMGDMSDTDRVDEVHKREVVELWRRKFPRFSAVVEGRVYAVADDRFVVPGPRVAEAAEELFRLIHPEASGGARL